MVSVVIPVYNVEKYLQKCLDSVIHQTYQNLEILLIDDGSTDNSPIICDRYRKKDNRIKVIHKENGGLSDARNVGIENSNGIFITFIDSDDYIPIDTIQKQVECIKKCDADIVISQMFYIPDDSNVEIKENKKFIKLYNSKQAIEESLYQKRFNCSISSKLYKKNLFNNIRFPVGRLSEDLAISHLLLDKASKIAYMNDIGYYYRQQESSIMHNFNVKRMDALVWALQIEDFCKNKYPQLKKAAECRTFNVAIHLLLDLPEQIEIRNICYKQLKKEILRTRLSVMTNNHARIRDRAAAFLSLFGENILKKIWKSKIAVKKV